MTGEVRYWCCFFAGIILGGVLVAPLVGHWLPQETLITLVSCSVGAFLGIGFALHKGWY
jgi:hypothetical protein